MKKLIALAFCIALAISVLTACGGKKDHTPIDDTTSPTTVIPEPSIIPSSTATQPSTIPDSGYMPNENNKNDNIDTHGDTANGMGRSMDRGSTQSHTTPTSTIGKKR